MTFAFQILPCSDDFKEPENNLLFAAESVSLTPGEIVRVPLGFKACFPINFVALIGQPDIRSFTVLATTVEGFDQQEWHAILRGRQPWEIRVGDPVAQLSIFPRVGLLNKIVDELPPAVGRRDLTYPKGQ